MPKGSKGARTRGEKAVLNISPGLGSRHPESRTVCRPEETTHSGVSVLPKGGSRSTM